MLNQMVASSNLFWEVNGRGVNIYSDGYTEEALYGKIKSFFLGDSFYVCLSTPVGLLVVGSYIEYSQEDRSWDIVYPNGEAVSMEALYCRDEFFETIPELKEQWEKEYENLHFGIPKVKFSYNRSDV